MEPATSRPPVVRRLTIKAYKFPYIESTVLRYCVNKEPSVIISTRTKHFMQQSSKDFCCLGVHFQSFDPDNQLKMSFEMNTKSRKIATPDKYSRIYEIYYSFL